MNNNTRLFCLVYYQKLFLYNRVTECVWLSLVWWLRFKDTKVFLNWFFLCLELAVKSIMRWSKVFYAGKMPSSVGVFPTVVIAELGPYHCLSRKYLRCVVSDWLDFIWNYFDKHRSQSKQIALNEQKKRPVSRFGWQAPIMVGRYLRMGAYFKIGNQELSFVVKARKQTRFSLLLALQNGLFWDARNNIEAFWTT